MTANLTPATVTDFSDLYDFGALVMQYGDQQYPLFDFMVSTHDDTYVIVLAVEDTSPYFAERGVPMDTLPGETEYVYFDLKLGDHGQVLMESESFEIQVMNLQN